jgi:hypothetical protein
MVTGVFPAVGPLVGAMEVTVGGCGADVYRKPPTRVEPWAPMTTDTSAAPADPAGVAAVIVAAFTTTTDVAATPRIFTVAGAVNPDPVIVTGVPPAVAPVGGEIPETIGPGPATVLRQEACST